MEAGGSAPPTSRPIPAPLDAFLAHDDAQVRRAYGRPARPDVVAGSGLHRHAWPARLLITVPGFLSRRVPRHPVTHVSYDRTAPGLPVGRTAVLPADFACLPGDPAAALPGARVAAGEEAPRAEVRGAVAEHLEHVRHLPADLRRRPRHRTPGGDARLNRRVARRKRVTGPL